MSETTVPDPARRSEESFVTALRDAFRNLRHEKRGNALGYLFIAPAVLLFLVFQGYPIVRGLLMAFSDYRWLVPETQGLFALNGLDNYRTILKDRVFSRSLLITLKYTALYLPSLLTLSLTTALLISWVKNARLAGFFRVVAYIPVVLPVSVSMMMWRQIYHPEYGFLNHVLSTVLGVQSPPRWLSDAGWAMPAVLIPDLWLGFGYYTLLFLIGLYNIDGTLYEAASIDGANGWQRLWHVTLPLLKPIMTLVLITSGGLASAIVPVLTLFQVPAGPERSMQTVGVYSYQTAFSIGDMRMGYAASMGLVVGVFSMIFTGVVFALLRTERS
ncbi:MAG: sugar ABC transporter permease [Chloroflexi bacterium]|nr:sugar ABC transporter permease [Chloroflexota bacterium]